MKWISGLSPAGVQTLWDRVFLAFTTCCQYARLGAEHQYSTAWSVPGRLVGGFVCQERLAILLCFPSPPAHCATVNVTYSTAKVSCDVPPGKSAAVLVGEVRRAQTGETFATLEAASSRQAGEQQHSLHITGLTPGTSYTVAVTIRNKFGTSEAVYLAVVTRQEPITQLAETKVKESGGDGDGDYTELAVTLACLVTAALLSVITLLVCFSHRRRILERNSASLHTSRYIERKAVMNNSEERIGVPPYCSPEVQSICREVSGQIKEGESSIDKTVNRVQSPNFYPLSGGQLGGGPGEDGRGSADSRAALMTDNCPDFHTRTVHCPSEVNLSKESRI